MRKKNQNRIKIKGLVIAILVSFTFSAVVCPSACAASIWDKTYGGAEDDTAAGETVQASDGGYAILGDTSSFGAGGSDFWLIKTDADGNMQWNKTYGGTGTETSGDMCLTSDGGYAMSGYTTSIGAGGQDFWLVKTDAAGNMLWNKTYGGTGNEYAYHVEQSLDGGYALLGQTNSFGAGNNDFWLVKTDASGIMEWNMTYGGTGNDVGIHVLQTVDGGYALAGSTSSFGAGSNDAWLIKTDAAGNMEWNQTYGGTGAEISYALLETSDGYYLLTINTDSFGAGGDDIWLVKTIPEGLTTGVMILLSTVAAIVGIRYLRKRPK